MNRREFIKAAIPVAAIPAIAITCKYEDDEKGSEKESTNWDYRVYCYERGQGDWTFSENIRGTFAHQREYMTFNEERSCGWSTDLGWMSGGKLHFQAFDDATNFVDMHVRTKDDTNLIDSIYDIYYVDRDNLEYESAQPTEIKVAHYWFNGDTGRTIVWERDGFSGTAPLTGWNKTKRA